MVIKATAEVLDSNTHASCSETRDVKSLLAFCPSDAACDSLDVECLACLCPKRCKYGKAAPVICQVRDEVRVES